MWDASIAGDVVRVVSLINSGADVDYVDEVCCIPKICCTYIPQLV